MAHRSIEMREKFLVNLRQGMVPQQAAKAAGAKNPTRQANTWLKDPDVRKELATIEEENRKAGLMTREKVQQGILEAIDMARLMADPMGMIRGYQEINKMNGFYATEEKKLILSTEQHEKLLGYEEMDIEDLAQLAGNASTLLLEGECETVTDDEDDEGDENA